MAATVTLFFTNGTEIVRSVFGMEPKKQELAPLPALGLAAELPPPEFGDEPVIALMPLRLLGEGAADESFIHGLAEDIISHLGMVPGVTTLSQLHGAAAESARELARKTGASHVIEGSVRQAGNDVRISIHLVDDRAARIFSKRFDRTFEKPFALMDEIAEVVTEAVTDVLGTKPEPAPEPVPVPVPVPVPASQEDALAAAEGEEEEWPEDYEVSPKSRRLTLFLCLPPMGLLGLHRFYTGRPFLGLLYILTNGFFVIGIIIDFLVILSGHFKDGDERKLKYWRPERKRGFEEESDESQIG